MNVREQIKKYIAAQPELKRSEIQQLHHIILELMPTRKLWFLDGQDEKGKTVSNQTLDMDLRPLNTPTEKPRNSIKSV